MKPNGIVALLTDFGAADPFVGVMKGVVLSAAPGASVVDIAHGVPPQNLEAGSLFLAYSAPYFPVGTTIAAVVDPGVGTSRRAVAVETDRGRRVAPDNGLLTRLLRSEKMRAAVELTNAAMLLPNVSGTFHGRDIFAPAAARLAAGVPLEQMGEPVDDLAQLPMEPPKRRGRVVHARVLFADRFGNLTTNLSAEEAPGGVEQASLGEMNFGAPRRSYGYAEQGAPVCVWNSFGLLELALNGGDLAAHVGWRVGERRTAKAVLAAPSA